MAGESTKDLAGTTVSHYRILDKLGGGGMGVVYRAQDIRLERTVALKFLPPTLYNDEESKQRFVREAKAASALDHPNICTIYEIDETDDGQLFIAMACYEGETLKHRLERGALPVAEAVDVVRQLALGLARTHERGLIHRDVKPANVFLTDDGQTKLLDFGLAKTAGDLDGLTRTGTAVGTPSYMSPEQVRSEKLDARTDLWSLGVLLYELLTGHLPFTAESVAALVYKIISHEPQPLTKWQPGLSEELQDVVSKLLRKQADDRYASCGELAADLDRLLGRTSSAAGSVRRTAGLAGDGRPEDGLSATTPLPAPAVPKRRPHWTAVAGLVLAAAVATGLVIQGLRTDAPPAVQEDAPLMRPSAVELRQLTTSSAEEIFPAFSPDGSRLAYSAVVESTVDGEVHPAVDGFEIFVRPLTFGGREIQLTSDGQINLQPAWSPDGQLVAYTSLKRGGIWVVPALGGAPRRVTEFGGSADWSPDGASLVFQTEMGGVRSQSLPSPPSQLWRVALSGGAPEPLTELDEPPGVHASPSFSPTGEIVAFESAAGDPATGEGALWFVSVEDRELTSLETPCPPHDPVFSPTGEVYFVCAGANAGLWMIRPPAVGETAMPAQRLERLTEAGRHVDVAPEGERLAFTRYVLGSNVWSLPLAGDAPRPAAAPVALTRSTSPRNYPVAFSPDGKWIAYQVARAGSARELWLMDATGAGHRPLAQADGVSGGRPTWIAGSRELAFQSAGNWVAVDVETQRQRVVVELDERWNEPSLSPDGTMLLYSMSTNGVENVWVLDVETGSSRQLTFVDEFAGWPLWSPDGLQVAVEVRNKGVGVHLGVVPAAGGELVQLTSGPNFDFVWDWSPDSDKLLFARSDRNIWWVSVSDGSERQLTSYGDGEFSFVRYPLWSPLGDQIIYEIADTTSDIWLGELVMGR